MIPCQRDLFEIPEDLAYLNCAYMSPLLRSVRAAGEAGLARKATPWKITAADFFEGTARLRERFADLAGARSRDVAIVPSASYGMAVAAANVPLSAGQTVLLLDESFPSIVHGWRARAAEAGAEAILLERPADNDWTSVVLDAIDRRTAVAALPHCHWTDGAVLDLRAIGTRLREVAAALVVDATQSLGAYPFPLAEIAPDFLVAAGYKWLLGPYSVSYLYAAERWHTGRPIEYNWITRDGSEDFAGLVRYRDSFQPGARRFDVGEVSNFALIPAATTGIDQLLEWGVEAIQETLAGITARIVAEAEDLGLRAVPSDLRAGHYLGLRFPEGLPPGLPDRLAALQVYASVRGNALRVTPHVYNSDADVDRLMTAIGTSR